MLKRSILIPLVLILVLSLVGASSHGNVNAQGGTPAPTAMTTGPTPIPPASFGSGATKIDIWDGLTGSDGAAFQAMLAQYAKETPDVTITDEEIGWNDLYAKLTAAFVAGTPPPMFVLHAAEIPQFASQGLL